MTHPPTKIAIIGVPIDLGANRRGVDMGPSALRVTGLADRLRELGHDVRDFGDVDVPLPETCDIGAGDSKYAAAIQRVCESLCEISTKALAEGRLPVVLGGDHSLAMGSIAATAGHYRTQGRPVGLIWFDAHGDMNTPQSTRTGNVHGMPLAHVLGMGDHGLAWVGGFSPKVRATQCVLVGIRDLDDREREMIQASGVTVYTMKDVDRLGASVVMERALATAGDGTAGVHVSFDIDACDPAVAPGVGTPKKGGLDYRESHLCLELIADSGLLIGLDLVEVNPIFDTRNVTGEFGSELILSAMGKAIF
ncbi:MAG TPA: arginase [Patescibacteria group bacterium]|nr:arginase [Patescibacteria group bacterium]